MVMVSLDVAKCRDAVAKTRTLSTSIDSQASVVQAVAGRAHEEVPSLGASGLWSSDLTYRADEMDARIDLAILVNGGDEGSGMIDFEVTGTDDLQGVKEQIGLEVADYLRDMPRDPEGREDVDRMLLYMGTMEEYADDATVTTSMFNSLGPEETLNVPDKLRVFQEYYSENASTMGDEGDRFWDDDTLMTEKIEQMQGQFMEAYSTSLGTATRSGDLDDGFAAGLANEVTDGDNYYAGWGLSQILRRGDYDADFLVDVAEPIYEWEKDQDGAVWGPRVGYGPNGLSGGVSPDMFTLGDDSEQYFDPFTGIFEAMGRNPEASLEFFDNAPTTADGDERDDRMYYFVDQRNWDHDGMNAIGEALDAATTSYRDPDDPRSERSAWLASATVHFLNERVEGEDNDREIGDAGKDSFGHILATYVADIDRMAPNTGGLGPSDGIGVYNWGDDGSAWANGLPPGAEFNLSELTTVMTSVLQDDDAVRQLANATREFNADRIALTGEAYGDANDAYETARDGGASQAELDRLEEARNAAQSDFYGATQRGSNLNGFTLGTMEVGTEEAAAEADQRVKDYISLAGDVAGLIPIPGSGAAGDFAGFLAEQAINQGKDVAEGQWGDSLSGVNLDNFNIQQATQNEMATATIYSLAENGLLPESAMDNNGEPYPWFVNGRLDPEIANSPDHASAWANYLSNGQAGSEYTRLIPDLTESFDSSHGRGKEGK